MYGFYIDEDRRKARRAKWNTVRIISIGFFGVILLGSLLLWLPFSNHQPIRYIDALFTAVTCVCVTGLVTVVPAAQFTVAGKVILLILIQIGGLGIIACTTAFLILVGKRINMKERVVIQEAYGLSTLQGMIRFIERVLWGTFLVEGIGAIGYSLQFIPEYGVAKGIFYSVFHSISAFCNAGVDILGDSSFTRYVNTPVITITTTMLVILSGLGYPVWIDLAKKIKMTIQSKGKRPVGRTITRLSLQSKIVLTMTLFLLTLGTVGFYLLEHRNPATMGSLSIAGKLQASFFQSVTTRTAGFASISQSGLTNGSKLLACMLMIIGGSPAGTAGGIKTTTVAVLLLTAISVLRGNKDTECYGRKIAFEIIRVGMTITLVTFVFWLFGVTVMTVIEPQQKVLDLMYEATSAMATVGLTADLTPVLSDISHVVLMLMMYIGRIGPMTMALIFSGHADKKNQFRTLPEAKIMVG